MRMDAEERAECRATLNDKNQSRRQRLAAARHLRADAYHGMDAVLKRSGDAPMSQNDQEAYDRMEARFDELNAEVERLEHEDRSEREQFIRRSGAFGGIGASGSLDGVFLPAEARMTDWTRAKGLDRRDDEEQRQTFSLGAAVRGIATGRWDGAEHERRALDSGASGTGGVLVPSMVASEVIDALRNQATAIKAGARIVPMDAKSVTLPQVDSLPTPGWRAENAGVQEDEPGFGGITLTAKTLAVLCRVPYELFEDVSAQASQAITDTLVTSLALEVDRAAYFGDGTNDAPTGLINTNGVNITPIATDGAVPEDYSALIAAYFACRRRNARPNSAVYSERTAETLAGLTATDGQPLLLPPALADLSQFSTNAIPDDETVGTGTDASSLICGQFDQLAIGFRPEVGFRVVSSREAYMSTMQVAILAYVRADIGVIRPAAFDVRSGILAA